MTEVNKVLATILIVVHTRHTVSLRRDKIRYDTIRYDTTATFNFRVINTIWLELLFCFVRW